MPELFTILGTASTLTLTAGRVVKLLYELHDTLHDAPLILLSVIAECAGMRVSLAILQESRIVQCHDLENAQGRQVVETFDDILMSCALTLSVLEKEIQTYIVVGKGPYDENAVKRCRMIISEDYLAKLLDQLRGQKSALTMLMTALNSNSIEDLKTYAKQNRNMLKVVAGRASMIWRESDSFSRRLSTICTERKSATESMPSVATSTQFDFDRDLIASIPYQRQIRYARMLEQRQGEQTIPESQEPAMDQYAELTKSDSSIDVQSWAMELPIQSILVLSDGTNFDTTSIVDVSTEYTANGVHMTIQPLIRPGSTSSITNGPIHIHSNAGIDRCLAEIAQKEYGAICGTDGANTLKEITMLCEAEGLSDNPLSTFECVSLASTLKYPMLESHDSTVLVNYDKPTNSSHPRAKVRISIKCNQERQRFLSSLRQHVCSLAYVEKGFENVWSHLSISYAKSSSTYKVVLIGGYVGKSTLIRKLFRCRGLRFDDDVGAEYHADVELDSAQFQLKFSDDISLGGYSTMRTTLWRDCRIAVICYSIAQRTSLDEVSEWGFQVRQAEPNCTLVLLGCQKDLRYDPYHSKTATSYEEGLAKAQIIGAILYLECSAKTSTGIDNIFELVTKCCILSENLDLWKSKQQKRRHAYKKQSSLANFSKLAVAFTKPDKVKTGVLATSWLADRLLA